MEAAEPWKPAQGVSRTRRSATYRENTIEARAIQILVLMATIIIIRQNQGLKFSMCREGNA